ncbi:hypothetical protein LNP74_04995 [Klebsiella pneumoniae subsp. pneumoniae]|nr:hypothetical protein [Klebsiella pneumoniae subsp. pneumoniae]
MTPFAKLVAARAYRASYFFNRQQHRLAGDFRLKPGDEPVCQPANPAVDPTENGPNAAINEQLATLVGLLHDDLLLIVRGNKLTKAQEKAVWLTALAQRAVQVSCQTPEYRAAAALAGRPGQNSISCSSMRRGQSAAVLLLRRQYCWRWRRRWRSGAALAGR